jgi:hypothetical protein
MGRRVAHEESCRQVHDLGTVFFISGRIDVTAGAAAAGGEVTVDLLPGTH